MSASAQAHEDVKALTKKLRDFSVKYVKISEADKAHSRELVENYVKGQVMVYCEQNSTLPILRLEYAGSAYEGLKTEAANEVDIKVVLKTNRQEVTVEDSGIPGYVRIKAAKDSKLCKYASSEGYINPKRLRNGWFYSLVVQAVNAFNSNSSVSDVHLVVRYHGPAIQLDITRKGTGGVLLSVDLVPYIHIEGDNYFAPNGAHSKLSWKKSFSLMEKSLLQHMDTDHGCRHELLRIVKTIVNRETSSLPALDSYHLKTAFMHYIEENPDNWSDQNFLGEHFIGFVGKLQAYLEEGRLPSYWLPAVNLLEGIKPRVVQNMAKRMKNILTKKGKRNKVLK